MPFPCPVSTWLEQPEVLARRRTLAKALGVPVERVKPLEVYDMVATRQAHGIPLPASVSWTPELLQDLFALAVDHFIVYTGGRDVGVR